MRALGCSAVPPPGAIAQEQIAGGLDFFSVHKPVSTGRTIHSKSFALRKDENKKAAY